MNAADFYVVPGLKRLCEQWLVETLKTTNMVDRFFLGFSLYVFSLNFTTQAHIGRHIQCSELERDCKGDVVDQLQEARHDP